MPSLSRWMTWALTPLTLGLLVQPSSARAEDPARELPEPLRVHVCAPSPRAEQDDWLEDVELAIRVEARKAGQPVLTSRGACGGIDPERATVMLLDGALALLLDSQQQERIDLSAVPAPERAAELARVVLERAQPAVRAGSVVREGERLVPQGVLGRAAGRERSPAPTWRLGAQLGASWVGEQELRHHGGQLEFEAFAATFDDRLELSLGGAWSPEQIARQVPVRIAREAGELVARIRGGMNVGSWQVRFGLGAGWQSRRLSPRSDLRFALPARRENVALLMLEPELVRRDLGHFRLALALPWRIYFGGTDWRWQGETAYAAPTWSLGLSVRLGFAPLQIGSAVD